MQAVGLKTYIWNNNFRATLLLAGFPVLLLILVWAGQLGLMSVHILPSTGSLGGNFALSGAWLGATGPLALIAAAVWYVIAFFGYQSIIDLTTGARKVTRTEQPELYNLLENLCISRGQPMPDLRIVDTDARNAWASGLSNKRSCITVTSGLLETLNKQELECVLGHELTHVINRDARVMVIAAIFAGVITLVAEIVFRLMIYSGGDRRSKNDGAMALIAMGIAAFGYLLAIVIRMAISRRREFIADMGSVELTKNPDGMISALMKISGHSDIEAPKDVQAMFLDNHDEGFASLFASHPPIDKRIAALVKYAGGHVPERLDTTTFAQPAATSTATAVPPTGAQGPWA